MVIITEIVTLIKSILAIKQQRRDNNQAYEILRTTLEVYIPNLERMDAIFDNEEATLAARSKLHQVVEQAKTVITKYEDLTIQKSLLDYSQEFARLNKLFDVCVSGLMLYVSFSAHDREKINYHTKPGPPPGPSGGDTGYTFTETASSDTSGSPETVKAILTIRQQIYRIQELEKQNRQ